MLLKQSELEVVYGIRKAMSRMTPADVTESIIETLMHTKSNEEFITLIEKIVKTKHHTLETIKCICYNTNVVVITKLNNYNRERAD